MKINHVIKSLETALTNDSCFPQLKVNNGTFSGILLLPGSLPITCHNRLPLRKIFLVQFVKYLIRRNTSAGNFVAKEDKKNALIQDTDELRVVALKNFLLYVRISLFSFISAH